ncbi:SCP2 sterol-binding domain-containing protein [Planosporangium mesophilum]|uniref:SCP2 domain-containing protein n=1 Tax=Planosporangium mesophilum TaxID=689768 RepID=A0A8J3X3H4_9ACTN|nr:SCP2 sterol-binding domain-containing protein [Planosporangium mesophilum]NJC84134.1 SCP2 sterol-binding domain-containing protein [Planosporangium mesophilum]GII22863.1 hypothetical protein Pme01_24600 [Planosporangium mesophilum]
MTSPTEEFFDDLVQRTHIPLLKRANGTIRFDLMQGACSEHWLLSISDGDVSVSRDMTEADCYLRADRELFDRIAVGDDYVLSALLRGVLAADGDLELVVLIERLLPGPQGLGQRRATAGIGGSDE